MIHSGAGSNFLEGAIASVPEELVDAQVRHIEIGEPVIIVIPGGGGAAESAARETGTFGDVLEGAVAPVPVKPVRLSFPAAGWVGRPRERAPVQQEEVDPAVVIIVEHRTAGAIGEQDIGDPLMTELVDKADSCPGGNVLEKVS